MTDNSPVSGARPSSGGLDVSADELAEAERLSQEIDELLEGRAVDATNPRLAVAARLIRLPALLPSVDTALWRRVLGPRPDVATPSPERAGRPSVRALSLAAVALAAIFALVLTAPGQIALARLAAMFQLDSVQVGINTPSDAPSGVRELAAARIERPLASLELAQAVAPVDILALDSVSTEWSLTDITAVYYPDLPADVPLNVVLTYELRAGGTLDIVEYFVRLGDNLTVDALTREDDVSTSARQIPLNGRTAVLIESGAPTHLYTLMWQQDGLLIELDAQDVTLQDLTLLAQSLQPVE